MAAEELTRICIGCSIGEASDLSSLIVALLGVLISLIGAGVSFWAVRASSKNHDALILREEFQPHRIEVESALRIIESKLGALELSAVPGLPWARIEGNFAAEQADVELAALSLIAEAQKIDARALVKDKWEASLSPLYRKMEQAWSEVDRSGSHPEPLRRAAASEVVRVIGEIVSTTRTLLEAGVRAPLVKKKWQ